MKIVHICKVWYPRTTGVTVHVDNLAAHMARAGHRVTVVTYDLSGKLTGALNQVNHVNQAGAGYDVIQVRFGPNALMAQVIQGLNPDVVHAHGIWEHVWPAFCAARRSRANFYITAHGTWQFLYHTPGFEKKARQLKYLLYYHTLWRLMVNKSCAMIALNAIESRAHGDLGAKRIYRVSNGVDCTVFHPGAKNMPETADLPASYILFAGAVQAQKGIFTLINALAVNKGKGVSTPLIVAGEGPALNQAKKMAVKENLDIRFLGQVARHQMPGLMAGAGLFVLPSVNEPFATVYLEAMACQTPCVGTCTGGTPEIIDHGENGFLIPAKDSEKLARILAWYARDPGMFVPYGQKAQKKVHQAFDWPVLTWKLLNVYSKKSC